MRRDDYMCATLLADVRIPGEAIKDHAVATVEYFPHDSDEFTGCQMLQVIRVPVVFFADVGVDWSFSSFWHRFPVKFGFAVHMYYAANKYRLSDFVTKIVMVFGKELRWIG